MCYNITEYREFQCAHITAFRQQLVDCNFRECRFSGMHEAQPHNCPSTCKQVMLPDQSIITNAHGLQCPLCTCRMDGSWASSMNGH
ncbi:hypothetical protein EV363DRAFT_1309491 [Boletus edulis]|nr:hypothetical protein EV363DRAFT_1309491 [Boletus edulis]